MEAAVKNRASGQRNLLVCEVFLTYGYGYGNIHLTLLIPF
jgi:hypothetical protein